MTRRPSLGSSACVALAALAAAMPALGHDYWLMPEALVASIGSDVAITLHVGDGFVTEEQRGLQRARTVSFVHVHGRATDDLVAGAAEDARPVARVRLAQAGGHLFAMERNATRIELPADHFESYLTEERLLGPLAERHRRGESAVPGRERYTRYIKSFVQVGRVHDRVFGRVLGQALEIVPARDPASLRPGDRLVVSVRFNARPLAGAPLDADSRVGTGPAAVQPLLTDAQGRATVAIDREGAWLVRLVHMERCEGCGDVDWRSWWASYSFGVCGAAGAATCEPPP